MTAADLLEALTRAGCRMAVEGDSLRVRGRLTDDLRAAIREHKQELLAVLRYGVPAARLYAYLGEKVRTPDGEGVLWQVFADRVGVVVADRVRFYRPRRINEQMGGTTQ